MAGIASRLAAVACAVIAQVFPAAIAGEANVLGVKASENGGNWRFDVTVEHGDEGWDHYADAWQVVGADGTVYGERVLLHPHETEQPFTRSLSGVSIPDGVTKVTIRARDSVHGWGGAEVDVMLPR